jgi:TonB-dependent receptor
MAPPSVPEFRRLARLAAVSAALAGVCLAPAQTPAAPRADDQPVLLDTYTVTSLRASLATAQDIKQNSPEFVDSIVAQDVGKFPDNTVAEALQRVPGIQVGRGNGEVSSVVIRGLPNIETTINGYEVFTGTGRGVAFQDIPAEMIAGLDAYKTIGPDKIEGGVAGLIDIRLRRPLDFKEGLSLGATLKGTYADQAGKYSYNGSFLVSNRWKTDAGEFGALIDVSYTRRRYQDQVLDNYVHFGANGETFDLAADASGTAGYYADNFGWQIIPGDRKRTGVSIGLQWKTKNGLELYSDTLFTNYRERRDVNFFIGIPSWGGYRPAAEVTLYAAGFDGWNNDGNKDGQPDRFVRSFIAHDTVTLSSTQAFDNATDTVQGAVGGKWDHDRLKLTGELSYSFSTVKTKGIILDTGITSPTQQLAITYNQNDAATIQAQGVDYANGNNYFLTQFYDQWSRAHSDFYAGKVDALIRLDSPAVKSLQFGTRLSDRKVGFRADSPGGTFIWNAASASSLPGMGMVTSTEPFLPASHFGIRRFWTPNSDWLLNDTNTNKLRTIFGKPAGRPLPELGSAFNDTEKSYAFYGLANYSFDSAGVPLDGVIGARFVNTRQDLSGFQHPIITDPATGTTSQRPDYVPTANSKSRWDVLPAFNGRLKLADGLFLRGSATRTVTRPNFNDLNPALSVTAATMTVPGSGSGGNPDLNPIKSTNYDLSLEYYLSKTSLVSAAGFYREIDGYVQNYASSETLGGRSYNVTRPRNTRNGHLQGLELTYQQFFDFLPEAFKGLGVQANYTYIEGKSENPLTQQEQNIAQVAKHNYNVVLIYEKGRVSSRLAYNWRGKFIDSFNQPGLQPTTVWVQPRGQLDFSASFELGTGLLLTVDATNLTRSKYRDNFGDIAMFARDVRNYDRTIEVGIRYRY